MSHPTNLNQIYLPKEFYSRKPQQHSTEEVELATEGKLRNGAPETITLTFNTFGQSITQKYVPHIEGLEIIVLVQEWEYNRDEKVQAVGKGWKVQYSDEPPEKNFKIIHHGLEFDRFMNPIKCVAIYE